MKRLKFKSSLVPLILNGSKTATWRMKDDKDLRAGDEMIIVDASTGEDFATATLTNVKMSSVRALSESDREGNESPNSKEELLADFQKTYGNNVTLDTPLKVVRFKIEHPDHR